MSRKCVLFNKKIRISLSTKDRTDERAKMPLSGEVWCTEKSKGRNTSGAGVCKRQGRRGCTVALMKYTTVLQAQLMVILYCALWAAKVRCVVNMYFGTDLKSDLETCERCTITSKVVYHFNEALNRLASVRLLRSR